MHIHDPLTLRAAGAAATIALLAGAPAEFAAGAQPPDQLDIVRGDSPSLVMRESRFRILDNDHDGFIERDEIEPDDPVLRSQFVALDADGDGRLSEIEYVESYRAKIR